MLAFSSTKRPIFWGSALIRFRRSGLSNNVKRNQTNPLARFVYATRDHEANIVDDLIRRCTTKDEGVSLLKGERAGYEKNLADPALGVKHTLDKSARISTSAQTSSNSRANCWKA